MKNRLILVYGVVVSLIYAFAVGFFAFNLISEYKNGYERTQITFDTMVHNIKSSVQKANPQTFNDDMINSIGSLNDYMSIEVKINGQTFINYPDHEIAGGKMTRSLFKTDNVNDNNIYVNANLYLLRPYTIFAYARISFLIILVTTLITIIILIYFNFVEKQLTGSSSNEESNEDDDETDEVKNEIEYYKESDAIDENSKIIESSQNPENTQNQDTTQTDEQQKKDGELDIPNYDEVEEELEEASSEEKEEIKQEQKAESQEEEVSKPEAVLPSEEVKPMHIETLEESKPAGLFSPTTGFGWPQYFNTRLENELRRATASEIDLALFLIKIPRMDKHDETILSICKYLSEQFQFTDLLFEFKDDSFAAIKIAMNLDEALTFADRIHEKIEKQLAILDLHCYIGISTRTIRLISADRILKEAEEALVHAQAEPDSPIIAFRVNVDKYKEFVEKN
ncbi:MAG: hypothetical protein K6A43_06470 [Treponema sp.]|nr:hypothetical protein [Treponema sp.]